MTDPGLKRILTTLCALWVLSLSTPGNAADTGIPQRIFFRYSGVDRNYGKVAFVDAGRIGPPKFVDGLICEVVYVAGERGICLGAEYRILGIFAATLFDARTFGTLGKVPVKGIPSRARVAVNGKVAASTVFTSGHGYDSVSFSTQTLLIDVASAQIIADVETFSVQRDGKPFKNRDFNFWGVTFSPDSRYFYATPLAEKRSVDDQLEWLNDEFVLYTLPDSETRATPVTNVWRIGIDGNTTPELLLKNAYSPAVVRAAQ